MGRCFRTGISEGPNLVNRFMLFFFSVLCQAGVKPKQVQVHRMIYASDNTSDGVVFLGFIQLSIS